MKVRTAVAVAAPAVRAAGAVALVVALFRPIARSGLGSALSIHELFDLLLADRTPAGLPRWLGVFGYLPAIGGALVLTAEAFSGRRAVALRVGGLVVALGSVVALVLGGPWRRPGNFGSGLWWGVVGCALLAIGTSGDVAPRTGRARWYRRRTVEAVDAEGTRS